MPVGTKHLTATGPNKGKWKACMAKVCRNKGPHPNSQLLKEVAEGLEVSSIQQVSYPQYLSFLRNQTGTQAPASGTVPDSISVPTIEVPQATRASTPTERLNGPHPDSPYLDDGNHQKEWRNNNGELHRVDGPAVIRGLHREWWSHGVLHRVGAPAIERGHEGIKEWWQNGIRHRVNGPAYERLDGTGIWWKNGVSYGEGSALAPNDG